MLKKIEIPGNSRYRQGSALIIVLGFLSFMIISGVSFAIYMRIEHQAASNYRHNVTARHLLNAGLARAIDEVDSELRIRKDWQARWVSEPVDSGTLQTKFPKWKDWPGRCKVSATADTLSNTEDARVLSLEALSYLPAVLVSDVRRFAVRRDYASNTQKDQPYMGAKWRSLERAIDGNTIGRYAYVCVNVSDMLDINRLRAALPLDSATNHVSIGSTFRNQAEREKFDLDAAADRRYLSLQDFYTARDNRSRSADSSPYHDYLNRGEQGLASFGAATTERHTFITDSLAKSEPARKDAIPISNPDPNMSWIFSDNTVFRNISPNIDRLGLNTAFWEALRRVPAEGTLDGSGEKHKIYAALLKDYLDEDSVPSLLTAPTLEVTPMVSQIVVMQDLVSPQVVQVSVPAEDPADPPTTIFYLQPLGDRVPSPAPQGYPAGVNMAAPIYIELVFPFKYAYLRKNQPTFELEVEAYIHVAKDGANKLTTSFQEAPVEAMGYYKLKQGATTIDDPWNLKPTDEDECYLKGQAILEPDGWDAIKMGEATGGNPPVFQAPFAQGQEFSVSLIVFARVKLGNEYVDSVPQFVPRPRLEGLGPEAEFAVTPKLFFQSETRVANDGMDLGPIPYKWTSLEVPDPRFNHNASNWLNTDLVPQDVSGAAGADANSYRGINQSTKNLLGKDGRDGDIFMAVSDAGYMQSPGELGFIVRPYDGIGIPDNSAWDFSSETRAREEKYMFRTFRLYDHGTGSDTEHQHDFIYNNFTLAAGEEFLPGPRINPLSDFDDILETAIWDTPLDFWLAATNNPYRLSGAAADAKMLLEEGTFSRHFFLGSSGQHNAPWDEFVERWSESLIRATTEDVSGRTLGSGGAPQSRTIRVNREWASTLSDVYGDWDVFRWYSLAADQAHIFDNSVPSTQGGRKLHEIDRKMLYAFSLDSFSDRQQLFLIFVRAEAALPALGMGSGSGSRSLAGGRAVALVWRDPYPRGYDKASGSFDTKGGNKGWYPELNNFVSPWLQYYTTSGNDPLSGDDPRYSGGYRWDSWHDTRVLFFKQLDN